jgi:hypothetical protein
VAQDVGPEFKPQYCKKKNKLPYDPAIPLLRIYPKECDSGYYKGTLHKSQVYGNSQDAPLLTNGLRKCGIYSQ